MSSKTYTTAVVLIPPLELWPPIQAIRHEHDGHSVRWVMPHITLLYPFRPREEFVTLAEHFSHPCAESGPFVVELAAFRFFHHGRGSYTLWLAPEPKERIVRLQAALQSVVPDCDDVTRYLHGFTPHLSVGQVRGQAAMERVRGALQTTWQPVSFPVNQVSLLWHGEPPDEVFRVIHTVAVGR
jgi:2'-5' RNA ligase